MRILQCGMTLELRAELRHTYALAAAIPHAAATGLRDKAADFAIACCHADTIGSSNRIREQLTHHQERKSGDGLAVIHYPYTSSNYEGAGSSDRVGRR